MMRSHILTSMDFFYIVWLKRSVSWALADDILNPEFFAMHSLRNGIMILQVWESLIDDASRFEW